MNFMTLNEDCVRHIFTYLDLNSLFAVSNVCAYFRNVVKNFTMKLYCHMNTPADSDKLENFLSLVGHHIHTMELVDCQLDQYIKPHLHIPSLIQSYCPNIKQLRFENFIEIKIAEFDANPKLETLEFKNSSLRSSMPSGLETTIKHLTLNGCTTADVDVLLEYLKMNQKISHLRLLNSCLCMKETMTGLFNADIISCLQNLQCLTITYSVKCSNLQNISKLERLKKLFLLQFSESKLIPLFNAFANKPECQLQEIHFHMCSLQENSIYKSLSKIKSLEVLEICKNFQINNDLLSILSDCQNLRHVRFFDCIHLVNDEGIDQLMRKCVKLQMLEIYWCSGITLRTVDTLERLSTELGKESFTFRIGGRTGINWKDSGPIVPMNQINRSTSTFRFEIIGESVKCDIHRHNCVIWPRPPTDH